MTVPIFRGTYFYHGLLPRATGVRSTNDGYGFTATDARGNPQDYTTAFSSYVPKTPRRTSHISPSVA